MKAAAAATTLSSAEADVTAAAAARKAGEDAAAVAALQIDDEPCTVMLSASGTIARSTPAALDAWESRSTSWSSHSTPIVERWEEPKGKDMSILSLASSIVAGRRAVSAESFLTGF